MKTFDKYFYYLRAVQAPNGTAHFVERVYRRAFGRSPRRLGEDFCGTFATSALWIASEGKRSAVAVDIDPEPLAYGRREYGARLRPAVRERLAVLRSDVRRAGLPGVDVLVALNFSYFVFHERRELLAYFRRARERTRRRGLFVLDCFGGPDTMGPIVERYRQDGFDYYWDQVSFDPFTHRAKFHIHIKRPGEKKRLRLFTYDWRMWTLPELQEVLHEAGFLHVDIYWEGTARDGTQTGNGVFRRRTRGEPDVTWVAYLVAR